MYTDYLKTPLGNMEFKASDTGLTQAIFCGLEKTVIKTNEITDACKEQLLEYFESQRKEFDIPLAPQGTPFQNKVWTCLSQIPFGEVLSYQDIANILDNPEASQAVGGANGRNPISLIIPCHRVIGSNGNMTGYAGGLERKYWLLKHEGVKIDYSQDIHLLDVKNVKDTRQAKTEFLN